MAAVTGITLIKSFVYRQEAQEEFGNTYWLRSAPPSNDASWAQLVSDLVAIERLVFNTSVKYVSAYGYNDDASNAHAVYSEEFNPANPPAGSFPGGNGHDMSGDQAAMVWWRTSDKNSRGKWIYLRKYIHGGYINSANKDELDPQYKTALTTFASQLDPAAGAFWGGVRGQTNAAPVTAHGVSDWVTTRTLRRRGKRPLPRA